MGEITLKLDTENEHDLRLLEVISRYKAQLARGEVPSILSASGASAPFPSPAPMAQIGSEMNTTANALNTQTGAPRQKMNTKERAKVAAKARWEKVRKSAGVPQENSITPKVKKLKAQANNHDLSRAHGVPIQNFPTQRTQDIVMNAFERQPYPDGREIIDGSFEVSEDDQPSQQELNEAMIDEEEEAFIQDVRRRAKDAEES